MKLSNILTVVNQVEKSKFVNFLDRVCSEAIAHDKELAKKVRSLDGQIKNASSSEIVQLFQLVLPHFENSVKQHLSMLGAQAKLLVNIISRDGNSIARGSWIESLYSKEWELISKQAQESFAMLNEADFASDTFDEAKRLHIYHSCLSEAHQNDIRANREAKITDDERGILNILAEKLDITAEQQSALEHLVNQIPQTGALDCLNALREIGLVFIRRKDHTIFVADEVVSLLNRIEGKELADKHILRVLRTLSDAELSNILKSHGKRIRGVERPEKIKTILQMKLSVSSMLQNDICGTEANLNDRKERLKELISDLSLDLDKLGSTIDERTELIINSLNSCSDLEFNALSATGFKEMFSSLQVHLPDLTKTLQLEFEIEDNEPLTVDRLRALSITPHDILYVLSNDQVKDIRESMGLGKRGNARQMILESFADATDRLIDNYEALSQRDLAKLKAANIEIAEADIGVKFEETTKAIFEQLGLTVDEDLRKSVNTAKDKADILLSLSEDDVIIGEAKTCKNGDFAKYSTTSRQVKAYVNRCEAAGKRVAQVLIIAPSFSDDFIDSADTDTEINISLLEAKGLKLIYDAFKSRRNPKFTAKLFTKGGLLKADLIAKNI
ncbi:hypothetical protein [Marinomonas ostreistagni]|uniref:Restriction endonuclease type IV Mrr domain-containing protein n=1 Tax=Marinomonas ostreistagni TaxID=359209 RepID=A0ABS0ZG55_9GAMM|nr:hypothetical protein [Marinomonas ostreistagni]MBJ7552657.1 hypothetical protein [Marinomonas ostreistagni]